MNDENGKRIRKRIVPLGKTETLIIPLLDDEDKGGAKRNHSQLATLKALDLVAYNEAAEHAFIALITDYIKTDGEITPREVYSETAYELGCSVETAKRYLLKYTARRAPFKMVGGRVSLRGGVK